MKIRSAQHVPTVVVKSNNRNRFEDGPEQLKADRLQSGDQTLHFGFSWQLRKRPARSVGRINGREGSMCTAYICMSFSSSSYSCMCQDPIQAS